MKTLQYFSDEYLKQTKRASPTQIAKFLEDYRSLHSQASLKLDREPTKLISIRLTIRQLSALKTLSRTKHQPYQTLIKQMIDTCLAKAGP